MASLVKMSADMNFEQIFQICTLPMRINRCHPAIVRDKIWVVQCLFFNIVSLLCFTLLVNSILSHDVRAGKYAEASKNGIMVIVAVTIMFKYFILVYHQDSINNLISVINEDYKMLNELSADERKIMSEYSERGIRVCKIWLALAIASSFIFPFKAFLLMAYLHSKGEFKLVAMFDLTYPGVIETYKDIFYVYCLMFAIYMSFACYASTMYLGFDPLVPIFMLHCCGQLEVVSKRIMKLFSETADEEQVVENLKKIIIKLQSIYRFVDVVKGNFTVLYEFTMKTTTFLMPLSAFQVVEFLPTYPSQPLYFYLQCLRNRDNNLEFIPFFIGTIVHFYMPCFYSDLLMEKSEILRQAIYCCNWEAQSSVRVRRYLLFMLARAARPLSISTVFYPICLDTFAEMCRTSYAIFNIMTAAWA